MDGAPETPAALFQCGLPAALEVMGERWSFLILRGAFNGITHFEQFQSQLGIARNILAHRLTKLVAHGILVRRGCTDDRRKVDYRLTEKGAALLPALVALRQWGERWEMACPSDHVLVDRTTRRPIRIMRVEDGNGHPLGMDDLIWVARAELDRPCDDQS